MKETCSAPQRAAGLGWPDDEDAADERPVGYPPDGLVTLRYLWDAVRRHARLWGGLALAGLLLGAVAPVLLPPPGEATTKLLLTHRPGDDPAEAIATDVQLASTRSVAVRVVNQLKLAETPDEVLKQYTVAAPTDRIIEISVSARSDAEATTLAATVADTFLSFRMEQVEAQQGPVRSELAVAQARVDRLEKKAPKNQYGEVRSSPKREQARAAAARLQERLTELRTAAAVMDSSRTLDPATPVRRSAVKTVVIYLGAGLAAGLAAGLGLVIVRALVSDRLWRRQAIAAALGTRVTLSLGKVGGGRRRDWWRPRAWLPSSRARTDLQRAVRHLRSLVFWPQTKKPTLAVAAVGDVRAAATVVAALASSFAEKGKVVLVADLSGRRLLAAELDVSVPGTSRAETDGPGAIDVHVPEPGAGPPEGLRQGGDRRTGDRALAGAWDRADLVLTLVDLSPALGAEHLSSWAARAVVAVTAGRATATRINTTGEMIRLSGVRLDSAILLGTDETDETAGLPADAAGEAPEETSVGILGR